MIHLELSLLCEYLVVLAPFVENTLLLSINCFGGFVKNQLPVYVWVYLWTIKSVLFI